MRRATQLYAQADGPLMTFVQVPKAKGAPGSALQWTIIAGIAGILLGLYLLGAVSLPHQLVPLFLLAVLCPFIAMIVGNLRHLLLVIIILDIPFQLDTHLYYHEEAAALGGLGGLSISVTTISLAALYVLWLGRILVKNETPPHYVLRTSLPLATYVAFVILSVTVARDMSLSLFEIVLLIQMFLLYVYIVGTVRTRDDLLFVITILLIALALESLVMIALRFRGESFQFAGILARIDRGMRVGGTVGSPNNAAGFLSLLLVPCLSILLTRLRWSYKWLAALAFGLGVIALVSTLSRGGWIAFVISMTILCPLAWYRGWLSPSFPIAIAIVLVLLSLLFHETILSRLVGDDYGSAYSRIPLMKLALKMIKDHPFLGIGANNFPIMLDEYTSKGFRGVWLYTVHNKYLLVAAETGIGGMLAFMWFLFATIRRGWQCWKFDDRLISPLGFGFAVAIIGYMSHMLVEVFRGRPTIQLLWLIAGFVTATYNIKSEENSIAGEKIDNVTERSAEER